MSDGADRERTAKRDAPGDPSPGDGPEESTGTGGESGEAGGRDGPVLGPGDDGTADRTTAAYPDDAGSADAGTDGTGWQTWLLVGATFVAFLVVPGAILVLPAARPAIAAFGLTYRDAYLVIPLVPALVLAALAVWAGVANRRAR
jgi:hypothetical protein